MKKYTYAERIRIALQRAAERHRLFREDGTIHRGDLANRLSVTRATVGNWMNKDQEYIDTTVLQRLADLSGCNLEWLLSGLGPMEHGEDEAERELLSSFRSLDQSQQAAVMALIRGLNSKP